jgi:hypothetical protein
VCSACRMSLETRRSMRVSCASVMARSHGITKSRKGRGTLFPRPLPIAHTGANDADGWNLTAELVAEPDHHGVSRHIVVDVEEFAAAVNRPVLGRAKVDVGVLDAEHEVLRQQVFNA